MFTAFVIAIMLLSSDEIKFESEFLALFKPMEFHYSGGRYHDQAFHYRLFDPSTEESDKPFPLIVWLHGLGQAGDDNVSHLRFIDTLLTPSPWEHSRFPFFVLVLQCPKDNANWTQGDIMAEDDMLSVMVPLLDATLEHYPIDRDRVYLAGISSGGTGCWQFASRRPDYFAAVAPMSGGSFTPTNEQIASLKQMPIWAFNCRYDGISAAEPVRSMVQTLVIGGVDVQLTVFEIATHDSWTPAFEDSHVRDWLLSQRRGESSMAREFVTWSRKVNASHPSLRAWIAEFTDLFRRWTWITLLAFCYLALVMFVIGRWTLKHFRIVRRKSRDTNAEPANEIMPAGSP